jgi:LacI family transcriptional regulator
MKKRENRRPTVREVAELAGVGMITVSRVINNEPSVSPATRKRVLSAIADLGYRRNEAARILMGHRATMIGLIVPDLTDAFFGSCAQTVQHVAAASGFMTLMAASEKNSDLEIEQAQHMASKNLSGILLVTSTHGIDPRLKELHDGGMPIVALDRPIEGLEVDAVVTEDQKGAEVAVRHLIEHGHKRVAYVGYDAAAYTSIERTEGYCRAMRLAGLKPNIAPELSSYESLAAWVAKVMKSKDAPTAMFSMNPVNACRLLRALSEAGYSVPNDVALVCFGDFEFSSVVSPALTTVAQSPVEMSKRAMMLLLDRIKHHQAGNAFSPVKLVLPANLIVRNSCGCTPGQ